MHLSKTKLEAIVAALKHACAQHQEPTRTTYERALAWAEDQQQKRADRARKAKERTE